MNNQEKIKSVFDEIHASDALFRKVKNMNKNESKFRNVMRYAITAIAGVAVMFAASNGVCYAATGETLTSKISLYINGQEQDADITWHKDEEGVYGELEVTVEEEDDVYFEITDIITEKTACDQTLEEEQTVE